MNLEFLFKILIFVLLVLILLSLASGLLFLVRDQGKTRRVITSLSLRVALSITLFVLLLLGYYTGILKPHGLTPDGVEQVPPVKQNVTEDAK